ncbi:hypothetical protein Ancab_033588 [Ancistrocladus abbreviatus]
MLVTGSGNPQRKGPKAVHGKSKKMPSGNKDNALAEKGPRFSVFAMDNIDKGFWAIALLYTPPIALGEPSMKERHSKPLDPPITKETLLYLSEANKHGIEGSGNRRKDVLKDVSNLQDVSIFVEELGILIRVDRGPQGSPQKFDSVFSPILRVAEMPDCVALEWA